MAIAVIEVIALFGVGAYAAEKVISSKITSQVQQDLPSASGVNVSIPVSEILSDITSNSISTLHIKINQYPLKGSDFKPSLKIIATNVTKLQPAVADTLEINALIPASVITDSTEIKGSQIIGNVLKVSVGSAGLGQASLIPKYSNNQIYFDLKSVSLFGQEIPRSSLPVDIQEQIKKKTLHNLNLPKGLKVESVSLDSRGLSLKIHGSKINLSNFASEF